MSRSKEQNQDEEIHVEIFNIKAKELERRKYLKEYYQKNKDKARSYQRLYNLNHRKKIDLSRTSFLRSREPIQMTYTVRDIALAPTEKSLKIFNLILSQKRYFSLHTSKTAV